MSVATIEEKGIKCILKHYRQSDLTVLNIVQFALVKQKLREVLVECTPRWSTFFYSPRLYYYLKFKISFGTVSYGQSPWPLMSFVVYEFHNFSRMNPSYVQCFIAKALRIEHR